jgi:hypothetical protein
MTTTPIEWPAWEVADVIRLHGADFLARHGGWLTDSQRQALRDLVRCRTAALGGHLERCGDCGHERIAYNSCRNRHCPKCQALTRARWLAREAGHLLPVEYYHVVFTLPAELGELALANPAVLYDALFQAAAGTLRTVAAQPKYLGAVVGSVLVLHTWGQNLHHHPHIHAIVTGGGLSCDASGRIDATPCWRACRPGFLLPVRVLSRVFRGQYLALVRAAFGQGRLTFPAGLAALQEADAFQYWLAPLSRKAWVVYAKPPTGGPEPVLKYLARYTHRVAISNARLLNLEDGQVTFTYQDYAAGQRHKTLTLSAEEFLRRWVQHVLPAGFVKTRHYGLLANRHRQERLEVCRRRLFVAGIAASLPGEPGGAAGGVAPARERCCPQCGGKRLLRLPLPEHPQHAGGAGDTS